MKCVKGLATRLLLYCQQWNLWEIGPRGRKLGCSDMLLKRHWDPVLFLSRGFIALLKQTVSSAKSFHCDVFPCSRPRSHRVKMPQGQTPETVSQTKHFLFRSSMTHQWTSGNANCSFHPLSQWP